MLYFKYHSSFKKVGTLENLLEKQGITSIINEELFNKRFAKGEDIYAFIDPYHVEVDGDFDLNWANTEREAWDRYYQSSEDI
jgi:hypothetical protein